MKASNKHRELMKTVKSAQNYLNFGLASGLYLNEINGQTFEIVDTGRFSAYIQYPDFFYDSVVHADEDVDGIIDLVFKGKISYIGEV